MKTTAKSRGPQTPFAWRVDEGVRAYQQAQRLNQLTTAMQYLAADVGIAFSTLSAWRRDVIPVDYDILNRFAAVCIQAAPELGEPWLSALLRDARMAGYRDQAVAEILGGEPDTDAACARPSPTPVILPGLPPELPAHYVSRDSKLQPLKTLVLAGQGHGAWIAILGMTGVGKSTLMTALAQDAEIQAAFAGGICWCEVKQGEPPLTLARWVAQAWQVDWPDNVTTTTEAQAVLRAGLPETPVLLLLDNVVSAPLLQAVRQLGPQVVVVLTTRTLAVPATLQIPEAAWLTIGELTPPEAWALAHHFAPIPEAETAAAQETLALLAYHPYAIQLTASTVQVLQMTWEQTLHALQHPPRAAVLTAVTSENQGIWASLNMDWAQLSSPHRYALAALGQLPFFSTYDLASGQAAWQVSAAQARVIWRTLAALQLVCRVPGTPDQYSLHWLVREFAQQQARQWNWGEKLRFSGWVWRYPLERPLRWWWPALPRPAAADWPWWSPTVPGTAHEPGWRSGYGWLMKTLWPRDEEGLRLRVTPQEWVTVVRLTARVSGLAALSGLWSGYGFLCVGLGQTANLRYVIPLLVVLLWLVLVTLEDLRRAILLGSVPAGTASEPETDAA